MEEVGCVEWMKEREIKSYYGCFLRTKIREVIGSSFSKMEVSFLSKKLGIENYGLWIANSSITMEIRGNVFFKI